jgi:hypothetical protein
VSQLSPVRMRLALLGVSAATIGLELALMRDLSLRYWSHFAYMVISVALLGFGASGTFIALFRRRILKRPGAWLCGATMAFSASIFPCRIAAARVPLDVRYLAWDFSQIGNIVAIELLMFVPLFFAGVVVGVALLDAPEKISGHYAANLVGSGFGAVMSVALMYVMPVSGQFLVMAILGCLATAAILPWRRAGAVAAAVGAVVAVLAYLSPPETISQYKMLAQVRNWGETEVVHQSFGPLGRIDVLGGRAIHYAPGLSLQFMREIPPHVLLIVDGDQTSAVYDPAGIEGWEFKDYTTAAAVYHLRKRPEVCIIGAGGGADIGLAAFHRGERIVALEINDQVIDAMGGPLKSRGGGIYNRPGVTVLNREARGYFASAGESFDVIQLPMIDAFGASGAGLYATRESYLYTVEAMAEMYDNLADDGVLAITRWARTPPRDELRIFDTAAEMLRGRGGDPGGRLAMIRSWATVTVMVFRQPITPGEAGAIGKFCADRSFDLCYLPGLDKSQANRHHLLDEPYYFQAATALLGPQRAEFLDDYIFAVDATTDDRPYFFHSFRWRAMDEFKRQLGGASPAFLEVGYLMIVAALAQAIVLGVLLVVLPLTPGIGALRGCKHRAASLGFFTMVGAGFMLLEMGFFQKLILYLAHPIYSAAVVIAAFLIFGGVGSWISRLWPFAPRRLAAAAAAAVAALGLLYLAAMDSWLGLTQSQTPVVRFIIAALTIAPLAVVMGHVFPAGLRHLGRSESKLIPWAWAANGFASVVATVAAPLVAMSFGFTVLTIAAVACYLLAGLLFHIWGQSLISH